MPLYTVITLSNQTRVVCVFEPGVNVFIDDDQTPEEEIVKKWSVSGRARFPDGIATDPYLTDGRALTRQPPSLSAMLNSYNKPR